MAAKIKIYNSLILSHLNYGILVWGFKNSKILKLQKKAIRIICSKKSNAHTDPLFKNLKLLKLNDIFTISKFKFYHKYINNKLPDNLQKLPLQLNQEIHQYNTRQSRNIYTPRFHHSYAKNCIRFDLPSTINTAPLHIQNKIYTHSIQGLANYMKNYYLQNYQESCVIANCYICNNE